jgi:hypothetical protein
MWTDLIGRNKVQWMAVVNTFLNLVLKGAEFLCLIRDCELPKKGCVRRGVIFFSLLRIRPIGLFQFRITSEVMNHQHSVGLLGQVISSSQGLYLHRTIHHRQTRTNIHALRGIRTRDPVYERSRPAPQSARPLDRFIHLFIH